VNTNAKSGGQGAYGDHRLSIAPMMDWMDT
jgi:hypothetical protein